jgi:hypothetical protein
MSHDRTVRFGVIGLVVAALCCFTPRLVVLLAAVGIGWRVPSGRGYLDYVLLPMLVFLAGLTIYALWRQSRVSMSMNNLEADCASPPPFQEPKQPQGDKA